MFRHTYIQGRDQQEFNAQKLLENMRKRWIGSKISRIQLNGKTEVEASLACCKNTDAHIRFPIVVETPKMKTVTLAKQAAQFNYG